MLTQLQQLSKINFESPPISPKTPASTVKRKTSRERGQKSSSTILSNFFQKKHKTSPIKEDQQVVRQGGVQNIQTHNPNDSDLHSGKSHVSLVMKEEPIDVEDMSTMGLTSVKLEDTASHSRSLGFEMAHSSSLSTDVKPIIKVECPVCSVSVAQHFINKHLDMCLSSEEKKDSLRSSQNKSRRPMPKLVYNLMSGQELKRRLKECHLPVQGSRDQQIKRLQDYIYLYNSECDSLNPKSAEEIAKEVEANEKIRNQLQGKTKPAMVFTKHHSEKEIEDMHSNYRKQHSSDFSRLIAQVKGRMESTRPVCAKLGVIEEKKNVEKSDAAVQPAETKSSIVIKVENGEDDEDQSVRSSSPALSDVSISSSISDIFGPESSINIEATGKTSALKRAASSRGSDDNTLPVEGKRQRKT
ncbi:E3 ubiquitin-protein ligase RAD18 isoform X2 [Austrofundulus limnaeus]|uniref:E3 ubiquitin-protein ligase RAD18 isoform X2 n=1 Tax=Austrofundulus limnaeus TaxID=52670 RepID=A0A2I4B9P3_AUSLI|nr:PREDICTED: E3 ubiquitin-protein ligase RAD18 isoform X2 [Austrofundulus limnaeus]